jgi:hypothetical protein
MKTKDVIRLISLALLVFCFVGCGLALPRVKVKGATAQGPRDIGAPATVETGGTVTTLPVPAGSTVESTVGVAATASNAAIPAVVKVVLAGASELRAESHQAKASSGSTDSTVAVKRIEVESAASERRWLLWAAIGCGVVGLVLKSMLPAWPALSNGLLVGAVAAGAAWKLSEVPAWLWLAVLVGMGLLVAGYKRAEWDKNGNGVPDCLESKKGGE